MGCRQFEINLISASGLEDAPGVCCDEDCISCSNKLTEKRTAVDYDSGPNPVWNFTIKYNIGKKAVHEEGVMLVIKLFCMRILLADLYVGDAMTNGGGTTLTCKVQKSAGEFKLLCRFG
ncbi:hypothetical protein NMG60_11035617 [Bertholletia excelsa]